MTEIAIRWWQKLCQKSSKRRDVLVFFYFLRRSLSFFLFFLSLFYSQGKAKVTVIVTVTVTSHSSAFFSFFTVRSLSVFFFSISYSAICSIVRHFFLIYHVISQFASLIYFTFFGPFLFNDSVWFFCDLCGLRFRYCISVPNESFNSFLFLFSTLLPLYFFSFKHLLFLFPFSCFFFYFCVDFFRCYNMK